MKPLITFACGLALVCACSKAPDAARAEAGEPTALAAKTENALVAAPASAEATAGKPASPDGRPVSAPGTAVATSGGAAAPAAPASAPVAGTPVANAFGSSDRDVTIPAGTVLPVDLETPVGSDISRVEQPVTGRLRRAVTVAGVEVLPAGTLVSGHVTAARRPGKVKGRGLIALRFTRLDTPGAGTTAIRTGTISRLAPATKEKDALKIIAPAAAGAVIGRIAGGRDDAAKGAVIGGAAGTGVVLATRGKEVRLGKGANLAVRLTAPVTVRVPGR